MPPFGWWLIAGVVVVGVALILATKKEVLTEHDVREREMELQRKFVDRPVGPTGKTREKSAECSCFHCRATNRSSEH